MTKKIKKEIQILLKQTHSKLGKSGTLVFVRSGYARNYLIPLNIGELSTSQTVKLIERKQKALSLKEELYVELCNKNKAILEQNHPYIITKRVSEDNKIFGKVTLKQVKTLLEKQTNLNLQETLIEFPEIKKIGSFPITIHLHAKVKTQVKIEVISQ
jgi:large subunit ribosomal protein L9